MSFGKDILKQALGMVLGTLLTILLVSLFVIGVVYYFKNNVSGVDVLQWFLN